ncbi:hypothetical protein P692DRAFT_20824397, partial [Suillus brevipes Sb2]
GLFRHIHNYYYRPNAAPSTGSCTDTQPPAPTLSMQSSLSTAGSIPISYNSCPSSYVVINFNISSSSLPPSTRDLARLSDAHANRFETLHTSCAPGPPNTLATQPVSGNGREVLATTAKPDARQNTNTNPLGVVASSAAVLQPQSTVLATTAKPDAPQNTNTNPLGVVASSAAVLRPQSMRLQEDRPL